MARIYNKLSRFEVPLTIKGLSGQTILDIDLSEIHLPTWCLALCLLKERRWTSETEFQARAFGSADEESRQPYKRPENEKMRDVFVGRRWRE
jgi:hypothetical protein